MKKTSHILDLFSYQSLSKAAYRFGHQLCINPMLSLSDLCANKLKEVLFFLDGMELSGGVYF